MTYTCLSLLIALTACAEVASGFSDASNDVPGSEDAAGDVGLPLDVDRREASTTDGAQDEPTSAPVDISPPPPECNDMRLGDIVNAVDVSRAEPPVLMRGTFRDGTYVLDRLERYLGVATGPTRLTRAAYTIRVQGTSLQLILGTSMTPIGATPPSFGFIRQSFEIQTPSPFDRRVARMTCPVIPDSKIDVFYAYEQREDALLLWWDNGFLFHLQRVGPP